MGRAKRIWYLSHMRAAKVQASLRIRAVSPRTFAARRVTVVLGSNHLLLRVTVVLGSNISCSELQLFWD